jgi:RimJ/RimL family protein N-acetyltransferase
MRKPDMTNGDIRIRRWRMADAEHLVEALHESAAEMNPFLPWCNEDYDLQDASGWLSRQANAWDVGESYTFCVEDISDGRLLGCCALDSVDHRHMHAEMGYWVRTGATGRGVATRAGDLVVDFGLERLKLLRIELVICVQNAASVGVAENLGAVREGRHRNRLIIHGIPRDAYVYSIVPADREGKD